MNDNAAVALERFRHVCIFYDSRDEEYDIVRSFITAGFEHGDKAFHIIDEATRDDHLRRLAAMGIDVKAAQSTGQLEVRAWENAHLLPGHFDQNAMLALAEGVLQDAKHRGYPFTRWVANMGFALRDVPGVEDLAEYCARLNAIADCNETTILCTYDRARFDAATLIDVLRTHPAAVIGGVLQENPFYVPAAELMNEVEGPAIR